MTGEAGGGPASAGAPSGGRELAGRRALVTGASGNIGRAIAAALAEAGAAVFVHALGDNAGLAETERLAATHGVRTARALADLTDPPAVHRLVEGAAEALGGLDILVNNAGVRRQTPLGDITPEEWRWVMAVNLDAPFLAAQAALPALGASDQAAIVNIGGMAAHVGAAGRAHAVASKAGVVGLTRALASELAGDGITVNVVVPGLIDTVRGASAGAPPALPPNLSGRLGRPEEIAATVRFLAGPAARFVTGQAVHVNGGAYFG